MSDSPVEIEARGVSNEIAEGRRELLRVIALLIGVSTAVALLFLVTLGTHRLLPQLGRILIMALLGVALYRGAAWARRVTIGLLVLACLFLLVTMIAAVASGNIPGAGLMLSLLSVYTWALRKLWRSGAIQGFMAAQRSPRVATAVAAT